MTITRWVFFFALISAAPGALAADMSGPLYQQHCAACHGENGDGKSRARYGLNPPPRDFTAARAWDELTPERLVLSIRYGRPDTAMAAWDKKLSIEQIEGLAGYIRDRFMKKPLALSKGVRLYKKHCSACHGDKGNGAQWTQHSLNPAPRDFTTLAARNELTLARMINSVAHGRFGTAMMAFKQRLSDEQILSVVTYIRSQFMQAEESLAKNASVSTTAGHASRLTPPADMRLAFPHGLNGDAVRGQAFYRNNCFACHGLQGMGKGPRSAFINPPPRNFTADDARRALNRPTLFRAIARGIQGTVMPAWAAVLDNQQIADVAEYVFQTFIQQSATDAGIEAGIETGTVKKKDSKIH